MVTTSTTFQDRILAASNQNVSLLKTLSDTEYASSAISQTSKHLHDLQEELKSRTDIVSQLKLVVTKEQQESEVYRRSTVKRFAYRLSGKKEKFDAKAEQEEREYLEAVQKHVNACHELDALKESIAQSEQKLQELESVGTAHSNAQKELDSLYDSIFQGPTPEYPEEDRAEAPVQQLRQEFAGVQARLSIENQALSILLDADKFMQRAVVNLEQASKANSATGYGIVSANIEVARMTERSSMAKAECHLSQVEMLVSQAQRTQPAVKEIGNVELKAGQILGNVMFNNAWDELYVREEIEKGQKQLKKASDKLKVEVQAARKREDSVKVELAEVKGRLDEARVNLERVRAGTFESITVGLPSYQV